MNNKDIIIKYCIYFVSIAGLAICIAMLFPQVRQMIIELGERILHRKTSLYQEWNKGLLSYALGGICFIAFFDYCTLTASGKKLVHTVKDEIRECLLEIDWRSLVKPGLIISGIYLLGILSIIRANFLYIDDIGRAAAGYRGWLGWSRYISEFSSIFIHGDYILSDISPLPQLIAILILAFSSVLPVYILNDNKIKIIGLLAVIPLGLSPYILECLSYKFDAPYMALSVFASIVPFLFLSRKKAFVFCSVICLLVMCMTYQAASGIYLLLTLILGFIDWNGKRKTNREVFLFLGWAALSFCIAMAIFKLFVMKPFNTYVSNTMLPLPQLIPGTLSNFQNYVNTINGDFGFIWKTLIGIIVCFFIAKAVSKSAQNKIISLVASIVLLCVLFVLSYGIYLVLEKPLFVPRTMYVFGIFLAIISIYVVSDFYNIAKIFTLALSWVFMVFAFSYGNALADQKRYADFRATVLLQDLNALFPDKDADKINIQLKNTIGYAPAVRNAGKHNPVIYKLVPQMLMEDEPWANYYYLVYFNYAPFSTANITLTKKDSEPYIDFNTLDLPVVLKTYYHTIKSDGKRVLVELNNDTKL